jgi:bifunctional non-homologous end joining protein LigD
LHGEKLNGHWHLVRMRKRPGERQEPWLLIKATGRIRPRKIRSGYPGGNAGLRRLGPDHGRDRRRQEKGLAFNKSAKEQSKAAKAGPTKAARPAPDPRRKTTAKRSGKRQGRRRARARWPAFIEPCLATLSSKPPETGGWCTRSSSTAIASRPASATAKSR